MQEKKNALKSALSRKLHDEGLVVVDASSSTGRKTQGAGGRCSPASASPARRCWSTTATTRTCALAARNNPRLKAVDALGGQRLRRRRSRPPGALRAGARPAGGGARAMKTRARSSAGRCITEKVDGAEGEARTSSPSRSTGAPTRSRSSRRSRRCSRRQGRGRAHPRGHGKVRRQGQFTGRRSGLEEGVRAAPGGLEDRVLRGRVGDRRWRIKKLKPTNPASRQQTRSRLRRARPARRPHKPLTEGKPATGGAQQPRPHHRALPRRRPQAALPHHRLPPRQARHPGQGGVDRVRPEPLGAHRAAALRRRRAALHPGAGRARRWAPR